MTGLHILKSLSKEIREKIISKFGSIEKLHSNLFDLFTEAYAVPGKDSSRLNLIQIKMREIEDAIDELGDSIDGRKITSNIAGDVSEIFAGKRISDLDDYFAQFGTDYKPLAK
jgi:hypothetical protein